MVPFPLCLVLAGAVYGVYRAPAPFRGPDGTLYPSQVWAAYSDADWTEKLPSITRLPLVDVNPATELQIGTLRATADWTVGMSSVTATYALVDKTPEQLAPQRVAQAAVQLAGLHDRRAEALGRASARLVPFSSD